MSKLNLSSWKMSVLALAMLAVPMVASAARLAGPPPNVVRSTVIDPLTGVSPAMLYPPGLAWNPVVDYTKPNFAQSPNIRKFVDSLPGLGAANANNLGQYIPVAVPDTTTFAGNGTAANPASDYYELEIGEFSLKMHSDMPPTTLRGYAQVNGLAAGSPSIVHQYLGAAIIAKTYDPTKPAGVAGNGKPVRIKYFNRLPVNSLMPLPLDTTIMGAGMGPDGVSIYSQNRADIHLHGGATPWISDGTPHQWVTPAGETLPAGAFTANFAKGASFANVPDMIGSAPGCKGGATCFTPTTTDGIGTLYYTNEQSARLMFYHDHAYGTTRLNVYGGMAAPYVLYDQFEEDMIAGTNVAGANPTFAKILPDQSGIPQGGTPVAGGGVYRYGVPLVIQDKFFVNDATVPVAATAAAWAAAWATIPALSPNGLAYVHTAPTLTNDPLWAYYAGTTGGNFWFPHEYMPIENPFDPSGNTPNGRWDYSAFMIPPALPTNLTLPSPTLIPETFADTMVVNGTAFPYATLPPDATRFRILNACNDRSVNLQLYYAKDRITGNICTTNPAVPVRFPTANPLYTAANCTEVATVPASPNATYPTWPTDGRDGGVPDPTTQGPPWIQIGNEGGLLAQLAIHPQQPIDYEYSRQNMPITGVTSKSLLLIPAFRADVIVDLSHFLANDVIMVYNDAPAPMPGFWPLNDYYTDDPDQTGVGAAPSTPPGFGPNTRTVMQIRIAGSKTSSFDFSSTAKPGFQRGNAISSVLPAIIGVEGPSLQALRAALPKVFAASQPPPIVPQLAYNAAFPSGPHHFTGIADNYVMGYQTTMNISGTTNGIARIRTTAPGNNYLTAPTLKIVGGGGAGTVAVVGMNPIGAITLLTAGTGYTSAPTVTLGAPTASAVVGTAVLATAVATVSGNVVNAISIDEPGANYTNVVTAPTCTITGGGGTGATCSVMVGTLNTVGSITVTTPGTGYTRQPQIFLVPPATGGLGATAVATLTGDLAMTGKNLTEGFDVEYGRMDIRLGSTPNPLTPSVGAGFVLGLARYIDPPTEIMNDGETIIWRLSHLGVDSHAMHFHLFNMQVVNRVDFTNVLYPPYPEEIGWKETIRTNPMQDLIVAIRPTSMVLPFTIANSSRVLDPTTPVNSTTNFYPVAPPAGVAAVAQQSNVVTNFGWEYVWHCHLLGHEENDMMRPMVLTVAGAAPLAVTLNAIAPATGATPPIKVVWVANVLTTTANAPTGYLVQRASGSATATNFTTIATIYDATVKTYSDTALAPTTIYRYRVVPFNLVGNSAAVATIRNVTTATWTPPTVTLTAPAAGATFVFPAAINFTATATAGSITGSTITSVQYYNGTSLLGTGTGATYAFTMNGAGGGSYALTAVVTNSLGMTAVSTARTVTVTVPAPLVITTASPLPPYQVSPTAFTATLAATGGVTPYTWAVATGSTLPAGLSLTAGVLSGSSIAAGTYNFSLQVTDSNAALAATTVKAFTLVVTTITAPATMTLPISTVLTGSSQTFTWTNAGASLYQVWAGTTPGASNLGMFPSAGTTTTSTTVSGLPVNGSTVYIRLWSLFGTTWGFNDYVYTAVGTGASSTVAMLTPANLGPISGSSQIFTWTNAGALLYQIWAGTTLGASNLGMLPPAGTTGTTFTTTGLPTTGTVFIRLWSLNGTTWTFNDYSYTAGP
jgi:FtsP/CotA-like multicopper oxidase with cupredoxin domain